MPAETLEYYSPPPTPSTGNTIPQGFISAFRDASDYVLNPEANPPLFLKERSTQVSEKDWHLLPGTGFDVRAQINKLIRGINRALLEGGDPSEEVKIFLADTNEDIKHFALEYPIQRLVFPILVDIQEKDGQKRLVFPRYNNQASTDLTSEQERKGSVKRSIARIENFLIDAKIGSTAIMVSPPGWSDLDDRQGGKIEFADNQIYVFRKEENGLQARTLRTDLSLEESEILVEKMGSLINDPKNCQTQEERIINVVSSVFYSEEGPTFNSVVDLIRDIKRSKFAYKGRSFEEIYHDLSLGDKLLDENKQIKKSVEPLIDHFNTFVLQNSVVISEEMVDKIEAELGKTILRIHQAIKLGSPTKEAVHQLVLSSDAELKKAHLELKALPGCNGGGLSTMATPFGSRAVVTSLGTSSFESDKYGSLEFDCLKCKSKNRRPRNQLLSHCQHCKADVRC